MRRRKYDPIYWNILYPPKARMILLVMNLIALGFLVTVALYAWLAG